MLPAQRGDMGEQGVGHVDAAASHVFNVGYGRGFSVLEAVNRVTDRTNARVARWDIPVVTCKFSRHGFSRNVPAVFLSGHKGIFALKKFLVLAAVAGLASLTACNQSPTEQAADNIEANAEAVADNLEDAADYANTEAAEDTLENRADAVRETGDAQAEDMRTNDADMNLANGM